MLNLFQHMLTFYTLREKIIPYFFRYLINNNRITI